MRSIGTLFAVTVMVVFAHVAQAQVISADNVIMRVRAICNQGQGGALTAAFEINPLSNLWAPPYGAIGGYSVVFTYTSSKLVFQGYQQRYNTGAWASPFRSTNFGASAWFNQHGHHGNPSYALPVNNQNFSPATDCQDNPLNDGFYEIMRYSMNIMPTAPGTVTLGLFSVEPYGTKDFQSIQNQQSTAIFSADLSTNVNDSIIIVTNLLIPVELSAFNVTGRPDGSMLLSWHTATETSNLGFEIERGDGAHFERIGFVPGHGTTTESHTYSFIDNTPVATGEGNIVFYRLKQVDTDGTFYYSEIQSGEILPSVVGLEQSYPSPVRVGTSANIPFTLAVPADVTLHVYNSMGQRVAALLDGTSRQAGRHVMTWDTRSEKGDLLPAGVYFIRFHARLGGIEEVSANRQVTLIR